MFTLLRSRTIAAAVVAIGLATTPFAANADTVTFSTANVTVGLNNTQITKAGPDPLSGNYNVGKILLGGVEWAPTPNTSLTQLHAWCIDLLGSLTAPGAFVQAALAGAQGNQIRALIIGGDGTAGFDAAHANFTNTEAAATQLAIWKVMYGRNLVTSTTVLSNADRLFVGETLNDRANSYFDATLAPSGVWALTTGNFLLKLDEAIPSNNQQTLVTLLAGPTPPGNISTVPEPASMALISIGLIGLGAARRLRARRTVH